MNAVFKYFNAERLECFIGIIIGLLFFVVALYFLTQVKKPFYNGMAYPFLIGAFIEIIVCTSVYIRSPKDIERVNRIIQSERSRIQSEEIPRMETVLKNFVIYRWMEIGLSIAGIVLFFIVAAETLWRGVGLGVFIQATLILIFDFFAEHRGKIYIDFLKHNDYF